MFSTYPSVRIRHHDPSSDDSKMHSELVRATETWRGGPSRYDTVFVRERAGSQTISTGGLTVARVKLFFSFSFAGKLHECALVTNYICSSSRDPNTGMWTVQQGRHLESFIIPLAQILHATHLIPVYGTKRVPVHHQPSQTLDKFNSFYVNKYIDYESFELAG